MEQADTLLDRAFGKANKGKLKVSGEYLHRKSIVESEKVKTVYTTLHVDLHNIMSNFPQVDELPVFYTELFKASIDVHNFKKSLGAVGWVDQQSGKFTKFYYAKIRNSRSIADILLHKRGFYGRVSSAVKQIRKELEFLESSRKIIRRFPDVKVNLPTVIIAGFPNVGKTTLLSSLTGANPKIASYPFTTQSLMFGYLQVRGVKTQLVDTPGLLDRPLNKRNKIELHSILALKYLEGKTIFVLDPTETCGFTLEEQLSLLKDIDNTFKVSLVILNKSDIAGKELIGMARKKLGEFKVVEASADKKTGIEEIRSAFENFI